MTPLVNVADKMCRLPHPAYDLQMTYANFVGGKWVPSASSATFENRNPANTNDLIGLFPDSTVRTPKPPLPRRGEHSIRGASCRLRSAPRSSSRPRS